MINLGWSSSKRPSAKCAKSSVCENNAATLSHKQTSLKRAYYKLTIPHENVAATEKWQVRGRKGGDLYALYSFFSGGGENTVGKCWPSSCKWQVDCKRESVGNYMLGFRRMEIWGCLMR